MPAGTRFARRIKEIRERKGWSQDALATGAGTSRKHVSAIERNQSVPSIELAARLAEVLGTTVSYLVGEPVSPSGPAIWPSANPDVHEHLELVIDAASEEERKALETMIRITYERVSGTVPKQQGNQDRTYPDNVIRYRTKAEVTGIGFINDYVSGPEDGYDEPQPVVTARLPYFEHRIPAGPPDEVPADGYQTVEVLRHLAKESRYVVRVAGDSMAPEILDGDLLLVDYAEEPRTGKIVCALINGKGTVKRFWRRGQKIMLKATNPSHKDISIGETDELRIQGVVRGIVERRL